MRPEVQFWDKMLPDQPEHAHLYKGASFMHDLFDVVSRSSGIANPRDEFKLEQSDLFTAGENGEGSLIDGANSYPMQLLGLMQARYPTQSLQVHNCDAAFSATTRTKCSSPAMPRSTTKTARRSSSTKASASTRPENRAARS